MRQELISGVARQLSVIASKRVSLAVGLWGEPGIGKTHAAHAVLGRVPYRHLSLHATASPEQLASSLPRAETLPDWARAQLERLERGELLEPRTLAQTLAAALGQLAPFVLHIEDVHEAGAARLEMIQSLASALERTRGVGLLATSRARLPGPFSNHRLEPMSIAETAVLLRHELQADPPQDGLHYLSSRAQGNPLFALEFARYLRRQGFLWSDGQHWHWRIPPEGFVPVTVEALIAELTSSVSRTEEQQSTLEARAVLPSELPPATLRAVWARVAGLSQGHLEGATIALEQGGVMSGDRVAHPLVAEIVRRDLPDARRIMYARRAMSAFESLDPVLASEYVGEADLEPEEAADRLEQAARRLNDGGDAVRAARLLARAAERSSGERQAALALEAARQLRGFDVLECERLARLAMKSVVFRKDATFLCATAVQVNGRHDEACRLLESLPAAEQTNLEWWQAYLAFQAASGHNLETVRVWDERPDFQLIASAWSRYKVISCLIKLSDTVRAEGMISAALRRGDLDPRERARLLDRRTFILLREAQYEAVERHLTEIIELIGEDAFPSDCAVYYANRSTARTRLKKWTQAKADAERACKLALESGVITYYLGFQTVLALAQIHLKEYEQAELVLLEATSLAQHHSHERLCDCYSHLSFLYLRWNPPHGPLLARRYAHLALEIARNFERDDALASALEACCRAELRNDAPETALGFAHELERVALRTGLSEDLMASADQMGRAHAELGQRKLALPYLRRSVELHEAHGNRADAQSAALEIDRLENNVEAARQKLEWFEANDNDQYAAHVRRYFPQLDRASVIEPPSPLARLNVLGAVTLERDGQPVPTRARKRLEILTYLLETRIAGRSEASTLELVDALCPQTPEPEAKHILKQQMYMIRGSLGGGSVISTPTGYALGAVSSDAEAFLDSDDSSLWRGAYLGGMTLGWRPGVRDALTLALRTKAKTLLENHPKEAARLGSILVEMEPFDAQALHLAVRSQVRAGNLNAARSTYLEGRSRLLEIGQLLPKMMEDFLSGEVIR